MSEKETEINSHSFFEEFGPVHEVWIRFERGMQIILGVSLITLFGFLGESWGSDNVPYEALIGAFFRISWAFMIAVFLSPGVMLFSIFARRIRPFTRELRGRFYLLVLLATLLYCWSLLYISTIEVVDAMVEATEIAHPITTY